MHYLILATPDETKSCCHVTPASPAPYTVKVDRSRERKRQLSTSSQFQSLLVAPYMVMVDRPRRRDSKMSTVSQFHSLLAPYMVMVDRPRRSTGSHLTKKTLIGRLILFGKGIDEDTNRDIQYNKKVIQA